MATAEQMAALHSMVPAAQASTRKWGVPASVTLAQWIYESTWGTSKLALRANNLFGVKHAHVNLTEAYVEMPTAEFESGARVMVMAEFVKYATVADSFNGHAQLLATRLRYKPAMAVRKDPVKFAQQLQRCGYSTNPVYATLLCQAMHAYGLVEFDVMSDDDAAALPATVEEFAKAVDASGEV